MGKELIYILPALVTLYWVARIFFFHKTVKVQLYIAIGMFLAVLTLFYKEDTAALVFPFFYFAVKQKISNNGVSRFDWLMLLPSILFLPYNHTAVFYVFLIVQFFIIMIFNIIGLRRYRKMQGEYYVDYDIHAENLGQILALILAAAAVVFVMVLLTDILSANIMVICILSVLLSTLQYLIGRYTYRYHDSGRLTDETIQEIKPLPLPSIIISTEKQKPAENTDEMEHTPANGTSDDAVLLKRVIDEKLYLDPMLSLVTLATSLNTNRTYLSNAIHSVYNQNFSEFINTLRVEHAARLMRECSDDVSIKEIAVKSGYVHTQSFYRHFTELKQTTPKAWYDTYHPINYKL